MTRAERRRAWRDSWEDEKALGFMKRGQIAPDRKYRRSIWKMYWKHLKSEFGRS